MKPRVLDLFCGAGGAAMGYALAGFEVVGVDIHWQPHYPFQFYQADAFDFLTDQWHAFDLIHASPPCQRYSRLTPKKYRVHHPDLIGLLRSALKNVAVAYVIENVVDAAPYMILPRVLCGSMFGLRVRRHRLFECSFALDLIQPCDHRQLCVLVSGTPRRKGTPRKDASLAEKRAAMEIDWMTTRELDQAIPPAYTAFVGQSFLRGRKNAI